MLEEAQDSPGTATVRVTSHLLEALSVLMEGSNNKETLNGFVRHVGSKTT